MKFRMAEKSLFAMLLRGPWWASFLLAGSLTALVAALAPANYRWVGAFGSLPFWAVGCIVAWRHWQAPPAAAVAAQSAFVRTATWREFATALDRTWRAQGGRVELLTGLQADFCVQLGGRETLVSARRWKAANHGTEAIVQLAGAMRARQVDYGQYLLGHGSISDAARKLAQAENITVIEGDALARLLLGKPS